ncbi:hypothetical protein CI610_00903 [invertebrate metagenome]|uniref:Uncharacterized protein n=1 Tax=invertebrate metagenome TaxID=1711999 RepID=A0A2H9TA35_9ZZZZ
MGVASIHKGIRALKADTLRHILNLPEIRANREIRKEKQLCEECLLADLKELHTSLTGSQH